MTAPCRARPNATALCRFSDASARSNGSTKLGAARRCSAAASSSSAASPASANRGWYASSWRRSKSRAAARCTAPPVFPRRFPYQCLVDALREQLPLVAATDIGATWFAALTSVLPELAQRVGPLPELPAIRAGDQRRRLFDAFGRALVALARPRPLLVVLEDLHWASQVTFDALAFLLQRITGARIPFPRDVSRQRGARAPSAAPARTRSDGRRKCRRRCRYRRSTVRSSNASSHARVLLPHDASRPERLRRRSTGVRTAIRSFSRNCSKRRPPEEAIPATVASLVEARVAALSAETQTVAEVAALAGQRFSANSFATLPVTATRSSSARSTSCSIAASCRKRRDAGYCRTPSAISSSKQAIAALAEPERLHERSRRLARALKQLYPERSREFASQIATLLEAAESLRRGGGRIRRGRRLRARTRRARRCATRRRPGTWARDRSSDGRARCGCCASASTNARATSPQERADLDALAAIAEEGDDEELRCRVLLRRSRLAFNDYTGRDERLRTARGAARARACATTACTGKPKPIFSRACFIRSAFLRAKAWRSRDARSTAIERSGTRPESPQALAEMSASDSARWQCR